MVNREEFVALVSDAYEHLYDLVYLRTHALTDMLVPSSSIAGKTRARQLHDLLRDFIDELDPGPYAPSFSQEWRRHRYLVERCLKGLSHQEVADQFGVGLRQYYRIRNVILDEVASILWDRRIQAPSDAKDLHESDGEKTLTTHLELLRLEGGRLAQADRYASIPDVIDGILAILDDLLRQRGITLIQNFPQSLPAVAVQRGLLRQMLMGILGFLVERVEGTEILVTATPEDERVRLSVQINPAQGIGGGGAIQYQERLTEFQEMALLSGCEIVTISEGDSISGFELKLPVARRTVLVVDDSTDVIELYRRYLVSQGYRVVAAQNAHQAIDKARKHQPFAITLDLMMPEQDGWELLQNLLNDPLTEAIPIIVCTVLKSKELALSLGATAFLEKPVTERELLATLMALENGQVMS
jgi:CheY-like chemotaxis protein